MPDAAQLERWLKQLHDFGPIRATGTPQARAFEEWLATQVTVLGFTLERDQYRLTSWECDVVKDCAIAVTEDGTEILLPHRPQGVSEGAVLNVEISREAIPGAEPWKRPLGRPAEAGSSQTLSQSRRGHPGRV